MSSPLAMLANVGSEVANFGANYYAQKNFNRQQRSDAIKLTKLSYDLAQKSQRDSALNVRKGLEQAGLSPALMANGNFSPAQGSLGSGSGASAPMPRFDLGNALMQGAQIENIRAQNDVLKADAKSKEVDSELKQQELENVQSRDSTIDLRVRNYAQSMIDDPDVSESDKATWQVVLDISRSFNKGSLDGIREFRNLQTENSDASLKLVQNKVMQEVYALQDENGFAQYIADLPRVERAKTISEIGKIFHEVIKLGVDTELSEAQKAKIGAEIEKLMRESNLTYHKDWASMIQNGDYRSAAISFFGELLTSVGSESVKAGAKAMTKK